MIQILTFNWQIMFLSQHPYWQLTDNFKFYLTKSCFDLNLHSGMWQMTRNFNGQNHIWFQNFHREIVFWSEHPYWQIMIWVGHLYSQLIDDSKFELTSYVVITSLFKTDRCFLLLTDKTCFLLSILTYNWQIIPKFTCNWQVMFVSQMLTGKHCFDSNILTDNLQISQSFKVIPQNCIAHLYCAWFLHH